MQEAGLVLLLLTHPLGGALNVCQHVGVLSLDFGRLIKHLCSSAPPWHNGASEVGKLFVRPHSLASLCTHFLNLTSAKLNVHIFFFSSNVDLSIAGGVIWRGFCLCSCCSCLHEFLRAKSVQVPTQLEEWKYSADEWSVKLVRHMVMSLRCGRKR